MFDEVFSPNWAVVSFKKIDGKNKSTKQKKTEGITSTSCWG